MNRFLLALIFSLLVARCEKIDYVPDNPFSGIPTKVLMHRGCGSNTDFVTNTLPAAMYGFSVLDGVELDIQISKDGTLWLDHDNEVKDCSDNIIGCFNTMTDAEISANSSCDNVIRYYTVESVFQEMAAQYPEKFISLDIKGQYCDLELTVEDMKRMADAVFALTEKYNLEGHVLAESDSPKFLEEISEDQAPVCQALITLEDLDQGLSDAYKIKARAISYKFAAEEPLTEASVSLVHNKGFGMIVWVVNEPDDIASVWAMKPDFIETDNPDFKKYISN
jgi:glycerophosphoryl diester phosphodiesterase